MSRSFSTVNITPDWEALLRCIRRQGTPRRPHFIELFLDAGVQEALVAQFGLRDGLDQNDPFVALQQ